MEGNDIIFGISLNYFSKTKRVNETNIKIVVVVESGRWEHGSSYSLFLYMCAIFI